MELIRQREPQLGSDPSTAHATAAQAVARGTRLTIVPTAPGIVFNPDRVDLLWHEDLHEQTFRLRAEASAPAGFATGSIDVFVGPALIALVPLSLHIAGGDGPAVAPDPVTITNATSLLLRSS